MKFNVTTHRFHELVYSREALNMDRTYDKEKIKIMFEKDRFLVKDNRAFFVFSFSHTDDIMSLLSW